MHLMVLILEGCLKYRMQFGFGLFMTRSCCVDIPQFSTVIELRAKRIACEICGARCFLTDHGVMSDNLMPDPCLNAPFGARCFLTDGQMVSADSPDMS